MRDELKNFRFPPLELLDDYEKLRHEVSQEELKRNNYKIRATLKTYKIDVDNVKAVVGPTVTLYKVYPAPGVKISSITNLQDDIAMALHAKGVRMEKLADSVGIEVANDQPSIVPLKAVLNDDAFRESEAELPVAIGYTITQKVKVFDLAEAPHLLVAGATKQGKSVGLNVLISSLLYSKHPSELKFVFIDPKMVEFSAYARLLKHYLAVLPDAVSEDDEMNNAICKNSKQADLILRSLCIEMDARYELMGKALVNKVTLYNEKYKDRHLLPTEGHHYMPYIVVVVDEYADLTMSVGGGGDAKAQARSISTSIIRLAQKGRAAGIHVVLATQRPSVDVVTGLIKSNFPTRIAFRVFSSTDSKTILDTPGADKLIGKGDMIYSAGVDMERVQCAFLSNDEINAITEFVGNQKGYMKSYNTPYYLPAVEAEGGEGGDSPMVDMKHLDERFEEAARQVVTSQRGSTSDLQRKLGMGYAKAGRVMDQLEAAGIVGPQEGSKPRQVLVGDLAELERIIEAFRNAQN
ncbi:MAG: DNA translocase FtsK [Bacteroidales bacterium]|nr:DNA translocase FtsK [Bacteroidales bacterium]